ncbi:transposase, partial [Staphylococcus aureus]|uniref:transposase n=1 Tax=Staphylococcus aureus TaxID=1280 RepID=UPI002181E5E1
VQDTEGSAFWAHVCADLANRGVQDVLIVCCDGLRIKIRENSQVLNRAAYIAVGVDLEGIKHVLGIWVQDTEGSAFWAHVCADLANRGVQDVLIVCCDGL